MKARIFADENRKWWTLGALAFALFMIMLDNTVVNVALPSIQRDLGIGLSELEWTVNAYALTFAVLMLTGGKLADFLGRRRVFLLGLAIFTLSSLICGLATTGGTLIGARTLQGVGAALMLPATLSIISATFPPHQRGMAIGIWAGVSAMALAIGPLIGGLITEHIDWSWIFFVNVPIGVLGLIVGRVVIEESRDTSADQRLDIPGLLASGVGLFALTFALIEANSYGWTDPVIIGLFVLSAVSLAAFVLLELHQRSPMLDLSLFRSSTFAGRQRRRAPRHARHVRRLLLHVDLHAEHPRLLGDQDRGCVPADDDPDHPDRADRGEVVRPDRLARAHDRGDALPRGLARRSSRGSGSTRPSGTSSRGSSSAAFGMALVMTPMTAAALGSVPVEKSGVGSGVLNTFRQVGGALGIAVMGAIVASYVDLGGGRPDPSSFIDGFQAALRVSAVFALLGAVVALTTIRKHRHMDAGELAEAAA